MADPYTMAAMKVMDLLSTGGDILGMGKYVAQSDSCAKAANRQRSSLEMQRLEMVANENQIITKGIISKWFFAIPIFVGIAIFLYMDR